MDAERVLVTGGAGFIGSHIVDALIAAGHTVAVVDNLVKGKRENVHPAARFYPVDIRDARALGEVFAAERPQAVIHQAALADVRESLRDPVGYAEVNVIGTLNLLEAGRTVGTVRKFIFASTGGALYGNPAELPATEACPLGPLDPYGASKLACEYYIATYRHNYGLEYCLLRYANVYGPRQDAEGEGGVVAIFSARMLAGQPTIIHGDGLQTRDFVYVGDVAAANVLALSRGQGVYNIGTGVPTDVNTIFRKLAGLTGYTLPEVHGPPKPGEVRHSYLDAGKARVELGWTPAVDLAAGLERTVAFFRQRMAGR
ncbi:MAG: NAD-dependent epimerase/dehydratase family protein [Anaerolineae bacterium]